VLITDPAGRVTTLEIDEHGDLVRVLQPGWNAPQVFSYDSSHRMTHKQEPRGHLTTYVYGPEGRLIRAELPPRPTYDPDTGEWRTEQEIHYYAPGDTSHPVVNDLSPGDPDNPTDALPDPDEIKDKISYGDISYTGTTSRWGSTLTATDAQSRTVQYERDERDLVTRITTPEGNCAEFTYDENQNLLSESRMDAAQCALPPEQRDPAQVQTSRYTYEARFNRIKTATDPLGRTTTYYYDYELGQGEIGLPVRIEYPPVEDEWGQVVTPTEAFEYNAWGQLTRAVDLRGVATCYVYTQGTADEASGGSNPLFASGVTPVPGHLTQIVEDCAGSLERVTILREFDAAGNPQLIIEPPGDFGPRQSVLAYDARNRLTSMTDPLGVVTRFAYDDGDNLTQTVADAAGRPLTTTYTYDAKDLLLGARGEGEGQAIAVAFGYDLNRRQTMEQDGLGNVTRYFYDNTGQ